jgi:hypothetical protein
MSRSFLSHELVNATDVMLGRGGESTYHCGNIAFRQLVEDHKNKYYLSPRAHKSRVVAEVVRKWRQLTPPGRFLTRSNPGDGDKSCWHDVGDRRALKKASHSLRDAVRCFSIEKKQREREQLGHTPDCDDEDDPFVSDIVSPSDGRKRGRVEQEPEYMPSFSDTKGPTIGRYRPAGASAYISTLSVNQKKSSSLVVLPALEERPTKMRRVVCDEREEAEDDCRREGCDDDDDCGRGDDERCSGERDSCAREEGSGRQGSFVLSSIRNYQMMEYPAACSSSSSSRSSKFQAPPRQQPLFANACRQQQERLDANSSPCGSADWFTMADLPVAAAPPYALPTADVLVREVNQAANNTVMGGSLSDDESLGWFSEGEEENNVSFFSFAPSVNVSLHKPLASRKSHSGRASSGREL